MARGNRTRPKTSPGELFPRGPMRGQRIGLLGGSFNPAHSGHLNLSLAALKHLALDRIWWMVSPGNPLKSDDGMAPFADRLASARALPDPRFRMVNGGGQPHTNPRLGPLVTDLSHCSRCGLRPTFLFSRGVGRSGRAAFPAVSPARIRCGAACRMRAAGLGLLPHAARPDLGHRAEGPWGGLAAVPRGGVNKPARR